jgi:hypothetical protein
MMGEGLIPLEEVTKKLCLGLGTITNVYILSFGLILLWPSN